LNKSDDDGKSEGEQIEINLETLEELEEESVEASK